MTSRNRTAVFSFLVVTLAIIVVPAFAQIPDGVSPGAADRIAEIEGRCPTFTWSPGPGAAFHELVCYRLPKESELADLSTVDLSDADQVLYAKVPGSASAWGPELAECLTPGDNYAWFVRAVYLEEEGEVVEASEWSYGKYFSISPMPSAREVEVALGVLRRYTQFADGPGGVQAESADTMRAAPSRRVAVPQQVPKSVTSAKTAIKGTVSDATGETYGVVGISNSPDGAGVAAANSNGGPELVLDGSEDYPVDAEFSESVINRPWGTPQTFNIRNSAGSGMTLQVDGVDVVTTATDQDAVGALSCASGEVAKYNGSAWNCAPDDDTTYSAGGGLTLLASEFSITPDGVTAAHLGADSVTASQIAANAVGISELDIGAIFEPVQNSFNNTSVLVDTIASTGETVATLAIDAPSAGSILAVMSALYFCNNCSVANYQAAVYCTLSTSPSAAATSGDSIFLSQYYNPNGQARESLSIHDVFDVAAGATTVYLRCGIQTAGDLMYVSYPHFSLIFIPD